MLIWTKICLSHGPTRRLNAGRLKVKTYERTETRQSVSRMSVIGRPDSAFHLRQCLQQRFGDGIDQPFVFQHPCSVGLWDLPPTVAPLSTAMFPAQSANSNTKKLFCRNQESGSVSIHLGQIFDLLDFLFTIQTDTILVP